MQDSRLTGGVVALSALAALGLRLATLTLPLRPDEAGFLLVARSWAPSAGSLYGPYFVDRPPLLIALVRATDLLGGVHAMRVLGALCCALLVLAAAGAAHELAGPRAARWAAPAMAALSANAMIDLVSTKGEVLALPLLMGGCWAALVSVRRRSAALTFLAGLCGGTALGLKQNLAGGLVFTAVLLVVAWRTGALGGRTTARLCATALLGAALPTVGTLVWALLAGVRPGTLVYAVVGFRADASRVLSSQPADAPELRALLLLAVAVLAGMALIVAGFVRHLREAWRLHPAASAATAAMLIADGAGLVLGGSFWTAYLFPLLPSTALATALLVAVLWRRPDRRRRALRASVVVTVVSTVISVVGLIVIRAGTPYNDAVSGLAVAGASRPGDTLTVFGGAANLQYYSGLDSPYPYLWSLPMRVLDPSYEQLVALLGSREAPTWVALEVGTSAWGAPGADALDAVLARRYVEAGRDCADRVLLRRRDVERPALRVDCGPVDPQAPPASAGHAPPG